MAKSSSTKTILFRDTRPPIISIWIHRVTRLIFEDKSDARSRYLLLYLE